VAAPAPAPAPPEERSRRIHVGVSFLPMALGKLTATAAGQVAEADGAFALGVGVSAGYEILPGLLVGVAPQAIFKGKPKEMSGSGTTQYDLMARVAYGYTIPEVVTLYAEVLPGYSYLEPSMGSAKGLTVAFGVGAAMDLTKAVFVNLGVGYQLGFQKQGEFADYQVDYLRMALGGGVKF
jgi:hypothetical protein